MTSADPPARTAIAMARPPGPLFGIEVPAVIRVVDPPEKAGRPSRVRPRKVADVRVLLFGRFHA